MTVRLALDWVVRGYFVRVRGMRRIARESLRRYRHATRRPFRREPGPATLIHCGHHKVGTKWFNGILSDIAFRLGLVFHAPPVGRGNPGSHIFESKPQNELLREYFTWLNPARPDPVRGDVIHYIHARDFEESAFEGKPFRGSHLIRDPRDVAVSGYHFHRWTTEKWVHVPNAALGGLSYQQYLNSLSEQEGLLVEIERTCTTFVRDMAEWNYAHPSFLELRYEDLIRDEEAHFARLFAHYGFTDRATSIALEIARSHSFKVKTGRKMGELNEKSHLRSGLPGQWRAAFGQEHVALFKRLANDILIRLGYEADDTWTSDVDRVIRLDLGVSEQQPQAT